METGQESHLKKHGKLYLIPNYISDDNPLEYLSEYVREQVHHLKHFVVETEKPARVLIRKLKLATPQQELTLFLWNEHSKAEELPEILKAFGEGTDIGIITDAGLPCVADPGADIVKMAHQHKIEVVPLPGPSSIFMALMASGMSGQQFAFLGYLPVNRQDRQKRIRQVEHDAFSKNQSQIFMEAPYRNNQLLEDVLTHCAGHTRLCIACNISGNNGFIQTKSIIEWRASTPDLHKQPVIFIIGK